MTQSTDDNFTPPPRPDRPSWPKYNCVDAQALWKAVRTLALGEGPLPVRLKMAAAAGALDLVGIDDTADDPAFEKFDALRAEIAAIGEDDVAEASEVVNRLVTFAGETLMAAGDLLGQGRVDTFAGLPGIKKSKGAPDAN